MHSGPHVPTFRPTSSTLFLYPDSPTETMLPGAGGDANRLLSLPPHCLPSPRLRARIPPRRVPPTSPPPLSLPGPRSAPPPARAPLLLPHSPDRPLRASGSGTALDPAPGPFAREAPESRPDPGQPPRPPLLRLRRRRSEPQTGNPPGPPSSPEPLLQLHKEPEPELPPPPAGPPRARLSARPAGRHGRLRAARLWARGGRLAEKAC